MDQYCIFPAEHASVFLCDSADSRQKPGCCISKEQSIMNRLEIERLLRELYAARVRGDIDAVCQSFSNDARFEIAGASPPATPVAVTAAGAGEFRALLRLMVKSFTLDDQNILSMIIDGHKAAVHWRARVHSRITGTSVPTELVDIIEVGERGRITRYTEFFIGRYL
jgi:ketosteroid isomerase-like protein